MKLTITEAHLDKALSVPWDTTTCILAQAAKDAIGKEIGGSYPKGFYDIDEVEYSFDAPIPVVNLFDAGYGSGGIKDPAKLNQVRAMLPITVEYHTRDL